MRDNPNRDQASSHGEYPPHATQANNRLEPNHSSSQTDSPHLTNEPGTNYWVDRRYRDAALWLEILVAIAILLTGAAQAWDGGQGASLIQAMFMPVVYAAVQVAGVWVQIATWTHPSFLSRIFGGLTSVAIGFVTMAAMMLATLTTYQAREGELLERQQKLISAEAERATVTAEIKAADIEVDRWTTSANSALIAVKDLGQQAGALPKDICTTWMVRGPEGRSYARQSCHPDPRTSSALVAAQAANNQLNDAKTRLADAKNHRNSLDQEKTDAKVADAKIGLRRATLASTLHMLAGVWFRKPAIDVSDNQLNTVLLFLVVVTSAAVAFCGQALAILSVRRLPTSGVSAARYATGLAGSPPPEVTKLIFIRRSDTIDRVIDLFRVRSSRDAPASTQAGSSDHNQPNAQSPRADRSKPTGSGIDAADNDNNVNSNAG
jgi:hypothetical protein